jgi:hypothetical protein
MSDRWRVSSLSTKNPCLDGGQILLLQRAEAAMPELTNIAIRPVTGAV